MPEKNRRRDDADEIAGIAERIYILTPVVFGIVALIMGITMACVFYFEFNTILSSQLDADVRAVVRAAQFTVTAIWLAGAFLGVYLMRDGIERADATRRLHAQERALMRLEKALSENDRERAEIAQKSRSFWNWRRAEHGTDELPKDR